MEPAPNNDLLPDNPPKVLQRELGIVCHVCGKRVASPFLVQVFAGRGFCSKACFDAFVKANTAMTDGRERDGDG